MTRGFAACLAVLGALLVYVTAPGFFTIDEPNHLATVVAYRHGRLTLPGLDRVSASPELAFFNANFNAVPTAPPANELPPLYGVIALPFAEFGLRGLIALNTLSFLATAAVLFGYVRRHAGERLAPWLAAGAFLFGSHSLEYALGIWPHSLSVFLCTSAFVLVAWSRERDDIRLAALAGLIVGIAAGVRYQNVVYAATLGLVLLLWAPRRWESVVGFTFAAALPLMATSVLNQARLGSWNPISKGPGYLPTAGVGGPEGRTHLVAQWAMSFWSRVVDDSVRPAELSAAFWLAPDRTSGAYLIYGIVKKAWLQSSPWVALGLFVAAVAWLPRRVAPEESSQRREMRACALPIAATLLMFAVAGAGRSDGISFNSRYLLELVPLTCALLAWSVARARVSAWLVLLGGAVGTLVALGVLVTLGSTTREMTQLRLPLALAVVLVAAFVVRAHRFGRGTLGVVLGVTLGWGAAIHLASDVSMSLQRRREVAAMRASAEGRLPEHAAVLVWGVHRGIVAAQQLEHDLVILDCARDRGEDAMKLGGQFLTLGRRVFILANGFPTELRERLMVTFAPARMDRGGVSFIELSLPHAGTRAGTDPPG